MCGTIQCRWLGKKTGFYNYPCAFSVSARLVRTVMQIWGLVRPYLANSVCKTLVNTYKDPGNLAVVWRWVLKSSYILHLHTDWLIDWLSLSYSTLKQTHCAFVASDSKSVNDCRYFLYSAFFGISTQVVYWCHVKLLPHRRVVHHTTMHHVTLLHAQPHT